MKPSEETIKPHSLKELMFLINVIQDRMEQTMICGKYFKAGMIVNRRLTREYKELVKALGTTC